MFLYPQPIGTTSTMQQYLQDKDGRGGLQGLTNDTNPPLPSCRNSRCPHLVAIPKQLPRPSLLCGRHNNPANHHCPAAETRDMCVWHVLMFILFLDPNPNPVWQFSMPCLQHGM